MKQQFGPKPPAPTAGSLTKYDASSMALHWAVVALVVTQFLLAELWEDAARPARHLMIAAHMTCGILLILIVVARITWRLSEGRELPSLASGVFAAASRGVQFLLYLLLLLQGISGFLLRWSGGEAMRFFGLSIAAPFAPWSKPANHLVGEVHDLMGWTIIALAAGHAGAALYHQYVLRDGGLRRMLPW